MTLRAHHLVVSLMLGAVVLSSLALLTVSPPSAQAACATGSSVVVTWPKSTTGTVSGVVTLQAQSTPTTASGLTFMLLQPVQQVIGEASQSGSTWVLKWDTRNQPNGGYPVAAIAHFGTATSLDCASQAVPIDINNLATQAPTLQATVSPNTWQGAPGSTGSFSVDTLYTDQYGRQSHVSPQGVNWHSTLGVANPPNTPNTLFMAGTALTSGQLFADVGYNGLAAHGIAQIKIATSASGSGSGTSSPRPTPAATTSSDGSLLSPTPAPLSTEDANRLAAMPTIFRPAAPTNSDPIVSLPTLSCLEKAVGKSRFAEISGGKSQPTAAERKLAQSCFVGPNPIPAVLAPVAPAHLTELPSTADLVSLASVKNHTVTSGGKKINGLLLTGTGAPNSSVFLYFFSDPLVLRAQTDSSGTWKYVLETPLKAGKHEVYAVAEKDAGNFVRTSAVPITVAAASGGQDGSLVVERSWSTAQIGFAAAAGVLVLAALGVLFTILRRRRRPAAVAGTPPPGGAPQAAVPTAPAPVIQPTAPAPPAPQPAAPAPASPPAPAGPTPAAPAPAPATPATPAPAPQNPPPAPAPPAGQPGHDAQV